MFKKIYHDKVAEDEARKRMRELELTDEQYEFCFEDWANWHEHLEWLLSATKQEIIDWIDSSK